MIVGAGQAAAQAVDTLRRKGFQGELALVGEEPVPPYQRPPLSKKYLAGSLERDRLLIRPPHFYADHKVETHFGKRAVEIERATQRVGSMTAHGSLTTSCCSQRAADPARCPSPGYDLEGVHFLRTIADVEKIRAELSAGKRLVVIGGGYIGLEVAATAREMGAEVTVLEMADRVMNRVTCPQMSAFYQSEHARHGVQIVCNACVDALVAHRRLESGTRRHLRVNWANIPPTS